MSEIWISKEDDPSYNLAFEEYLFREGEYEVPKLMIWRNRPSVVMGRFQNPWLEVNFDILKSKNTKLVRRHSGGGCVFHDKGNLNISFLVNKDVQSKYKNLLFVKETLESLGFENLIINERYDLLIHEKDCDYKFSGSAFRESRKRTLHHCTLLVDSNLKKLGPVLKPHIYEIESKSTPSKRSPVKNLNDTKEGIGLKMIEEQLIRNWKNKHSSSTIINFKPSKWTEINEYLPKYTSKEWTIGETPKFKLCLPSGQILLIKKGKIEFSNGHIVSLWDCPNEYWPKSFDIIDRNYLLKHFFLTF